jgi:hypothetical protein
MSVDEQLETILKQSLIAFCDDLISALPDETDFIYIRFFFSIVPMRDVIRHIQQHIVPTEPYVLAKDDSYFLGHPVLFEELNKQHSNRVNYFKELWKTMHTDENKQVIWDWLTHFIALGKRHTLVN